MGWFSKSEPKIVGPTRQVDETIRRLALKYDIYLDHKDGAVTWGDLWRTIDYFLNRLDQEFEKHDISKPSSQ